MKEKPILFSGPMVRAILDGRKNQTRRVVKWPEWVNHERDAHKLVKSPSGIANYYHGRVRNRMVCPYGQIGGKLWVKETFKHTLNVESHNGQPLCVVKYRAGGSDELLGGWPLGSVPTQKWWDTGRSPWSPSIFMPRWASRLTLEVADVRVERVQDISEDDARSEGCVPIGSPHDPVDYFHDLWDSINSKRGYPWGANPWVWVVVFKRVK